MRHRWPTFLANFVLLAVRLSAADNLCPNPGAEEGDGNGVAGGWYVEGGDGTWADDYAHSGSRSFKIALERQGRTVGWTSGVIPVTEPGTQFMLSVWAKLENVSGRNGAFIGFYHTDETGKRIGQSGMLVLGGAAETVATEDWRRHLTVSNLGPEVKGVRVNMRLYGASGTVWFDDVVVTGVVRRPLASPWPIRRGVRVGVAGGTVVVSGEGAEGHAAALRASLVRRGWDVPVLAHDAVDLRRETRDTIVLGNLATSRAAECLYLRSYTYEDLYFPGPGGFVLRPLCNPLGTGANVLVIGASDDQGLGEAVRRVTDHVVRAEASLAVPLTVQIGEGYKGLGRMPWPASGPRREMKPAGAYLVSGDLERAKEYRDVMLKAADTPDAVLFGKDTTLHLFYVTKTLSWDLMSSCEVFSDEERLKVDNFLLKVLRSSQGYDYAGLRPGMFCRENHGTRAAQAFYYGWRYFDRSYGDELSAELHLWRRKLAEFWSACFASSRSFEDSLSQHALGGSLDNTLDIAMQEPEWSADFFASGRAQRMGDRCIAITNNMGQTVLQGDTGSGDSASSVFSKLASHFRDGRYQFMIGERGSRGTTTDEALRGFNIGLAPAVPVDHIGLAVVPADSQYFHTALGNRAGVPFERAFDKLTFRSGFDDADEYLMIDGVAGGSHSYDDANTIGEFSANRRRWLCQIDIFNGPTMSFHNAVTVARGGLGDPAVPQAAELVCRAEGDAWGYTATRLPHYNGVAWTRHVLWFPRAFTYVLDELTAEDEGDYSFVLGWRSLGKPTLSPGRFESAQNELAEVGILFGGGDLLANMMSSSGKVARHMTEYDALLYRGEEPGDFIEVEVAVPEEKEYAVAVETLNYVGRGCMAVEIDGQVLGERIDLFCDSGVVHRSADLGRVRLAAGPHTVRFVVVDRNPSSDGHFLAVTRLCLGDGTSGLATLAAVPNRFLLLFPPDVAATLTRDTETLGKYLPKSRHHDGALNILEQTLGRRLAVGGSACFQNVFYAAAASEPRDMEYRRCGENCGLVRGADGRVTLVGAGVAGVDAEVEDLHVSGRMFAVGPERIILHGARVELGESALDVGAVPQASRERLQAVLGRAWERAGATEATEPRPTQGARRLLKQPLGGSLPAKPLSLAWRRLSNGLRIAVGLENGAVVEVDPLGHRVGEFTTGGPVHALCAADLDGDLDEELLVGSDDENLYALGADAQPVWTHRVPFLRSEQPWMWWTLNTSKVRAVHAVDLDGDGRSEILVGAGNMRLHCLDATGEERWRFRTDHGICTTIVTGNWLADGKPYVLAGNGLTSSNGSCWVLDAQGNVLQTYFNGSWCTSLPAVALGDLDGDGETTVFCGNNRGDVRAYTVARGRQEALWCRNLTRPVRSLTVLPSTSAGVVVVGSDSGYLCAFDQAGDKAWGLPLSSGILATARLEERGQAVGVAAGCRDGKVYVVSCTGELIGVTDCGQRLEAMAAVDVFGDGRFGVVVATSEPAALHVVCPAAGR